MLAVRACWPSLLAVLALLSAATSHVASAAWVAVCAGCHAARRLSMGCSCAGRQQLLCCLQGLAFMHSMHRLHQSLGPGSVILSTHQEIDAPSLRVQLRDLAFAVDIRSVLKVFSGPHSATSGIRWHCDCMHGTGGKATCTLTPI